MMNKQWNPKRQYRWSREWLPRQPDFHYERPRGELLDYVEDRPLEFGYGNVLEALRGLGFWHEQEFMVKASENHEDAAKSLSLSFEYNFSKAMVTHGYCLTLKRITFGSSLNDFVSYLAKGISIGSWDESEILGKMILKNLEREGWFSSTYWTRLAPFMIGLFCDWQKLPAPGKELFEPLPDFYEEIIANWKAEDPEKLYDALFAACEFHVERSREHTSREMFEFDQGFYQVYPAEILAVLKLREKFGLANPVVEHPLMQLPSAKLLDRETVEDEMLEGVKRKAKTELKVNWE